MMREILFRGRRLDNCEWEYGGLFHNHDGRCFVGELVVTDISHKRYSDRYEIGIGFAETDPASIGQFTGLTDKNGKKIFEGDILEYRSDIISLGSGHKTGAAEVSRRVVEWGEYGWVYKEIYNNRWNSIWNNYGRKDNLYKKNVFEFATVIGNIYDNPELLEV